jgi:hypothetical protein
VRPKLVEHEPRPLKLASTARVDSRMLPNYAHGQHVGGSEAAMLLLQRQVLTTAVALGCWAVAELLPC